MIRRVRTPEGARFYGQPIGSLIVKDPVSGIFKAVSQKVPDIRSEVRTPWTGIDWTKAEAYSEAGPQDEDAIRIPPLTPKPQVNAQKSTKNRTPDSEFDQFSPDEQEQLQALTRVRPIEITQQQRELRARWKALGFEVADIPLRTHGRWAQQGKGWVNEYGDSIVVEADIPADRVWALRQEFDKALATLPKAYFDADSDLPTQVAVVVPVEGTDPMFDQDFADAYVMYGEASVITVSPNPAPAGSLRSVSPYGTETRLGQVMLHEMGHIVDGRLGHTKGGFANEEVKGWFYQFPQFSGLYAGSSPAEAYAEMYKEFFAKWVDPYSGSTKDSRKYARKFHWAGRPKPGARRKGAKQPDSGTEPIQLARLDNQAEQITAIQSHKDALTGIEQQVLAGVRDRISQSIDAFLSYAAAIGINNPNQSPVQVFARPDVEAFWYDQLAGLQKDLAGRITDGFYSAVDLSGADRQAVDTGYLQSVLADLQGYLGSWSGKVVPAAQAAYNSVPAATSYQQGGTSLNVGRDTAVARWNAVRESGSQPVNGTSPVTDISKRSQAGIAAATHRGYSEGQLAQAAAQAGPAGLSGVKKVWVANFAQDPERGPCLTCIALHGQVRELHEQFDSAATFGTKALPVYRDLLGPPRHSRCRCKIVLISGADTEQDAAAVSQGMQDYAAESAASNWATQGFTSGQVRNVPEGLFRAIWRVLTTKGWLRRVWAAITGR